MANKKFWEVKNSTENENIGEAYIYGDIVSYKWDDTDTTAKSFKEDLDSLGDIDTLNIYINSPGGSVFQGQAIYNIIKRHKAKINIHVDGVAASIASVIAMAGNTIFMPKNSMMMIHNPWTFAYGNAKELRKQADDLDKIRESLIEAYLSKAGDKLSRETLIGIMDNETWLTAQECYDYGLCDELVEEKEIAASINTELFAKYKNTPKELLNKTEKQNKPIKNTEKIEKDEEIEALIARVNNILKFEEERIYE
ncbi:Clp protease ClpP [Clostridium botulinum]|uniref:head maturation protease, ClpP-related n=1 Tax=Clostridium botulinum TaxID=1491 RepID=UPI0001591F4E|nr:head maturation protease, ClpP-related [Clostridium botulinum]ABS33643.1 putative Clp protease [Clostridium botulinum A str. ATCC 19397]MBO3438450.1 Clp protease ClpP [Clostridium botulinum]MBY6952219.1 Clp protease ClpP [Clostridium botulinum]NFH87840.1 Clp protease ClpP [Clostridium botulinum]NFJ77459.1 Clp protease ClpP [Clostridium botulinum]